MTKNIIRLYTAMDDATRIKALHYVKDDIISDPKYSFDESSIMNETIPSPFKNVLLYCFRI
ncbi:hypothetical protein NYZ99_15340 [Maribacter litopenaei]|uniref:Uncharacterized protein n=1 Tax=Maribacter litopenaei TaxID=2976127 RepID=A0ABY5Y5J9_9FLAO|nr:hypothetical protein [Maribacter litopenaei]UWX54312.1 hypothetical protein NYZ99_15340 [Maribacter litopenaei]